VVFQENLCEIERVLNLLSILEFAKNLPSTSIFLIRQCEAEEKMWFSHE